MAIVIGQSGAYTSILEELARSHLSISSISELGPLRTALQSQGETVESEAAEEYLCKHEELKLAASEADRKAKAEILEARSALDREIQSKQLELEMATSSAREAGSLLGALLRPWRFRAWLRHRRTTRRIHQQIGHERDRCQIRVNQAERATREAGLRLGSFVAARPQFIAARAKMLDSQLASVSKLLNSGESSGAAAELEVIAILRQFNDDWYVLNDVRVTSAEWRKFNGRPIRSAQVDHAVVGPNGLFIIETKNWGERFVESGDYFDPFEQTARGAFLCFEVLKSKGLKRYPNCILLASNQVPDKRTNSYTHVVRPNELRAFIDNCSEQLSPEEVQLIVAFLKQFVANTGSQLA